MWERQFKNQRIGSKPIQVVVSTWDRIDITSYCTNVNQGSFRCFLCSYLRHIIYDLLLNYLGPVCFVDVMPSQNEKGIRRTKFDFVIVRSSVRTLEHDFTNLLHAFNFASVPSSNAWFSSFSFTHRPLVLAGTFI
jgi:hypothetical protein